MYSANALPMKRLCDMCGAHDARCTATSQYTDCNVLFFVFTVFSCCCWAPSVKVAASKDSQHCTEHSSSIWTLWAWCFIHNFPQAVATSAGDDDVLADRRLSSSFDTGNVVWCCDKDAASVPSLLVALVESASERNRNAMQPLRTTARNA